jgi:hypothetical protein
VSSAFAQLHTIQPQSQVERNISTNIVTSESENRTEWMEIGRIEEEKFMQRNLSENKKDSPVPKTFIIERSPNIRIEHNPSGEKKSKKQGIFE